MTISVLQVVESSVGAGVSATTIVGSITVASNGNSIDVYVSWDSTTSITISSTGVTSVPTYPWRYLGLINDATNLQGLAHFVADGVQAGTVTVTATFSATTDFRALCLKEIGDTSGSDSAATSPIQNQQTPSTTTDATTSGLATSISQQPILLSGLSFNILGTSTPAAGTGFTSNGTGWTLGGGVASGRFESKRIASTDSVAATFTALNNVSHSSACVIFKEKNGTVKLVGPRKVRRNRRWGGMSMGVDVREWW